MIGASVFHSRFNMKYLGVIFTCLVAIQSSFGEKIVAKLGKSVHIFPEDARLDPLKNCTAWYYNATSEIYQYYEIYPNFTVPNASFGTHNNSKCQLILDHVTYDNAGEWCMDKEYSTGVKIMDCEELLVQEHLNDEPAVTRNLNDDVKHFFKDEFDGEVKCFIKRGDFDPTDFGEQLTTEQNEGMELYKKCGVRMQITNKSSGRWTLIQRSDYKLRTLSFTIEVSSHDEIKENNIRARIQTDEVRPDEFKIESPVLKAKSSYGSLILGRLGNPVRLFDGYSGETKPKKCAVKRNDETYEMYPNFLVPNAYPGNNYWTCQLNLNQSTYDDVGEWQIFVTFSNDSTHIITNELLVLEVINEQYNEKIFKPTVNNYLIQFFTKEFDENVNCSIKRGNFDPKNLGQNLTTDQNEGVELYRKCGVRMQITTSSVGRWTLIQQSGKYKFKTLSFNIESVISRENIIKSREWFDRGTAKIWEFDIQSRPTNCDLRRPDGSITRLIFPYHYDIPEVNDIHAGTWLLRCGFSDGVDIQEHYYDVTVVDPSAIDVSVATSMTGQSNIPAIHMLCKTNVKSIKFCLFTKPNNDIVNVLMNVSSNNYEYFGEGVDFESDGKFAQCGLTIRQPTAEDYGLWKCTVGLGDRHIQALVQTAPLLHSRSAIQSSIIKNDVYVKRGDNFTIRCATNVALEYCWLRSPNGTIYSVTKNGSSTNSLAYEGEGLELGICGANIKNATSTHEGNWTCQLGVLGSSEIASTVLVTVTDSYMIPLRLVSSPKDGSLHLGCQILPGHKSLIEYCRWVHPRGHGIHHINTSQYRELNTATTCSLIISEPIAEDVGTWKCYARFATKSDEEFHANVKVVGYSEVKTTLIISIVCSLTLIIIAIGFIGNLLYRKKKSILPPYDIKWMDSECSKEDRITKK